MQDPQPLGEQCLWGCDLPRPLPRVPWMWGKTLPYFCKDSATFGKTTIYQDAHPFGYARGLKTHTPLSSRDRPQVNDAPFEAEDNEGQKIWKMPLLSAICSLSKEQKSCETPSGRVGLCLIFEASKTKKVMHFVEGVLYGHRSLIKICLHVSSVFHL